MSDNQSEEKSYDINPNLGFAPLRVTGPAGLENVAKFVTAEYPKEAQNFRDLINTINSNLEERFSVGLVIVSNNGEYGVDISTEIASNTDVPSSSSDLQKELIALLHGNSIETISMGWLQQKFENILPSNMKRSQISPDKMLCIVPTDFLNHIQFEYINKELHFFARIDGAKVDLPTEFTRYLKNEIKEKVAEFGSPISAENFYEQFLITWSQKKSSES